MADQTANAQRAKIVAEQRQTAMRRQCFVRHRQFERQHRLQRPHFTLKVSNSRKSIGPILFTEWDFFRVATIFIADVGTPKPIGSSLLNVLDSSR